MSDMEPIDKLNKDLRAAARTLASDEARYLVDQYYVLQDARIRADNQMKAMTETREPHEVLTWLGGNAGVLERNIKAALQKYAEAHRPGRWLLAQYGIGPVIAAGLIAHLDIHPWKCYMGPFNKKNKACRPAKPHRNGECGITQVNTAGGFWRFAGLDPTAEWKKGEKRPWNAELKVICWKAGESFKKFSSDERCYYGHLYRRRRVMEIANNANGLLESQAREALATRDWSRDSITKSWYEGCYKGTIWQDWDELDQEAKLKRMTNMKGAPGTGVQMLPPGRVDLRSSRYAVKLFVSHLHWVMYESALGEKPKKPYVVDHLGHADLYAPPGWPLN